MTQQHTAEPAPASARPSAPGHQRAEAPSGVRLDIQGLRALAVALVVLFHLFPNRLTGGYVGVDVFFVISGFLITAHLLREIESTGRVAILSFWARRVRRLIPASFIVLAASLVASVALVPEISRVQNLTEIGYATGYVLNWRLAGDAVDYLGASNPLSLVQHFWSLSVEEQFYLAWPVLFAAALLCAAGVRAAGGARRRRAAIAVVIAAVLVASFAWSVVETARSQPSAYFITTTRAWEFALGGAVALLPAVTWEASRWLAGIRNVLSALALTGIVWAALDFDAESAFPGSIAMLPVGATALLIWLGDARTGLAPQRLAHPRIVQFAGDTSYAVYLWHWPLIVLAPLVVGIRASWQLALIVLPLTVALAWATKRFVEDPVRRTRGRLALLRRTGVTFGLLAAGMAVLIGVSALQVQATTGRIEARQAAIERLLQEQTRSAGKGALATAGCTGALAVMNDCADPFAYALTVDPAFAQRDVPWEWYGTGGGKGHCTGRTVSGWYERSCDFPGEGPDVLVVGDSHVEHVFPAIQRVAEHRGWHLELQSRASCGIFVAQDPGASDVERRCAEWGSELERRLIEDSSIDTVIVGMRDLAGTASELGPPALERIRDSGKQVVLLRDIPPVGSRNLAGEPLTGPACLTSGGERYDACAWDDDGSDNWLPTAAESLGLPLVDPREIVCPEGRCHMIAGGLAVYTDDNHLTGTYALSLAPWFDRQLGPIVDDPAA